VARDYDYVSPEQWDRVGHGLVSQVNDSVLGASRDGHRHLEIRGNDRLMESFGPSPDDGLNIAHCTQDGEYLMLNSDEATHHPTLWLDYD
jgi:hypothetical protein